MKMYKHKNIGGADIVIFDSKKNRFHLRHGEECEIDMKRVGQGVVLVEEVDYKKEKVDKSPLRGD